MRRLHGITVFALLLSAFIGQAQASDARLWDTTGVAIRQGWQIEWQRSGEMDENGNIVYTWSDTRQGDRDVYAQKFGPAGQRLWPEDGALVVHALGRQEDPSVIPTGFGEYIFIWNDFRLDPGGKGDLFAQKLDASGNQQWDSAGVLLSTGDFDSPAEFRMVADGTGGAIILWNDLRSGDEGDIYALRVLADGTVPQVWPEDGLPVAVAPAGQRQITVDTDGAGGALVGWRDSRFPASGYDIYIQRLTIDAELAWGSDGVVVCDTILDQESPKICPNGSGGAYVVWVDKRQDYDGDLYFQIVSNSGELLLSSFPQGKPLLPLVPMPLQQEEPRIVADGSSNAIIIWLDSRNDPVQNLFYDVYAQKINSAGNRVWAGAGEPVCTDAADQSEARINADDAGGAVCVWMDERNGNESPKSNIYAQKINTNGSMAWTANGVPMCEAPGYQYFPLVRAAATYSFVAWGDERSGSKGIWHQMLNASGAPQLAANGDTLVWGISGDAVSPILVQDNLGKILIFYQDLREGTAGYMAYVQIVDTLGNTMLETNGRPICPNPVYTYNKSQQSLDACSDGGTGAIAAWLDMRDSNPFKQVYAQRVGADGTLYWGNSGRQVSSYDNDQDAPLIAADESGGAVIAWSAVTLAGTYDKDVHAARISHEGNTAWTTQITSVPSEDEILLDLVSDGTGGAYLAWRGRAWEADSAYDIYAQRVDASGNPLWANGVTLCDRAGIQNNVRIASLGSGGAIFVWEDARASEEDSLFRDLYAQKISDSGEAFWATNGIPVCSMTADQSAPDLSLDGQGHLFIVWEDFRSASLNLYIQKMTLDGQMLFAANGIPFCSAPDDQGFARIIGDGQGGNYVFWDDYRDSLSSDVYGIHLDSNGAPTDQWAINGGPISAYFNKQNHVALISDYVGGAAGVWQDKRSSGKDEIINLYAQRANEYIVGVAPGNSASTPPAAFQLYRPYPNPFNPNVRLRFQLERPGNIRLAVYDLLGRQVEELKKGWQPAGAGELTWQARNFSSGLYIVRLEFDGKQIQQKALLLK